MPTSRSAGELSGQALATKVVGVRGLETRQALERADAVGGRSGRSGRVGEAPNLLARVLEVDHLAGQLGLDTAQLGPAGGRAGRDVRQHAARLVDGHGERRPHDRLAALS